MTQVWLSCMYIWYAIFLLPRKYKLGYLHFLLIFYIILPPKPLKQFIKWNKRSHSMELELSEHAIRWNLDPQMQYFYYIYLRQYI